MELCERETEHCVKAPRGDSVYFLGGSEMTLQEVVVWILSGPGAGMIAYWLIEKIEYFASLVPLEKRFVSIALPIGIAWVIYLFGMGMGYVAQPAEIREWIEALFAVGWAAAGIGQLIHGVAKLPGRK